MHHIKVRQIDSGRWEATLLDPAYDNDRLVQSHVIRSEFGDTARDAIGNLVWNSERELNLAITVAREPEMVY